MLARYENHNVPLETPLLHRINRNYITVIGFADNVTNECTIRAHHARIHICVHCEMINHLFARKETNENTHYIMTLCILYLSHWNGKICVRKYETALECHNVVRY